MKKLLCSLAGVVMATGALMATTAVTVNAAAPSAAVTNAAVMAASDFAGTWVGEFKMPSGDAIELTYTFKVDGASVTGTVAAPQGDPIAIEDGKIDGDKLLFFVSYNGATIKHECIVAGDEMKVVSKSDDPNFPGAELTLKRVKDTPAPATPSPTK